MKTTFTILRKNSWKLFFVNIAFYFFVINVFAQSYCTTGLTYYGCDYYSAIDNFSISDINQTGTGCTGGIDAADFTSLICNLAQGETYLMTYSSNSDSYSATSDQLAIWIDLNNDFDFDDSGELIYSTPTGGIHSALINIPLGTPLGTYRMRVRCKNDFWQSFLSTDACTVFYYGETHDYTANITGPPPCPGLITVSMSNIALHTADISWACNSCTGQFVIEYGSPGFTPGSGASAGVGGTIVNASASPVTLSGLNSSSDYQVYVRRNCGIDGYSSNYGPVSFTTQWDVCATLTNITCGIPVTANIPTGHGLFDVTNCGTNTGKELLYSFTPTVSGIYTLTILNTDYHYASYLVKEASLGCNANDWNCAQTLPWNFIFSSPEIIILDTLQAGVNYYLCVDASSSDYGASHIFQIDCYTPFIPCQNVTTITCGVPQQATIPPGLGAFTNYNGNFNLGREKIYQFTPSVTGIYTLTVNSSSTYYSAYYSYKKVSEGCNGSNWHSITGASYGPLTVLLGTLIGGTDYYVLVDAFGMVGADQNFQIDCISSSNPCAAIQTISCGTQVNVNIPGGAGTYSTNSCNGTPQVLQGKEQIFQFTPTTTGRSYIYIPNSWSPNWDNYLHYYIKPASGGCNNTGWTCLGPGWSVNNGYGYLNIPMTLNAGTPYYIMVDAQLLNGNTHSFEISCPQPWDPCSTITSLPCSTSVTATIPAGAGAWDINCTNQQANTLGRELIYSFSPSISGSYTLNITATDYKNVKYLYKDAADGCNISNWECLAITAYPTTYQLLYFPNPFLAGHTYYLMLDAQEITGATHTFELYCTYPADPCANITSITCGSVNSFVNDHGLGIFDPVTPPEDYTFPGRETIFEFTPTVSGNHMVQVISTAAYNTAGYFIKLASDGCNNNNWIYIGSFYTDDTRAIPISLNAGISYYIMADSYTPGQTFTIICPSVYDYCSDVTSIPSCGTQMSLTIPSGLGAHGDFPGCSGIYSTAVSPGKEKVFSFAPSTPGYYGLKVTSGTGSDVQYFIKNASDGCNNNNWQCMGTISQYGGGIRTPFQLQSGVTYYIMADGYDTTGAQQSFEIVCPASNPCSNIISLSSCGSFHMETLEEGFNNFTLTGCGTNYQTQNAPVGAARIYSYTPTLEGINSLSTTSLSNIYYVRFFIKPAALGCGDGNWICADYDAYLWKVTLPYTLTVGTEYYLMVVDEGYSALGWEFGFLFNCPAECTQYADIDADGYGNSDSYIFTCWPTYGYVYDEGDCNDNNSNVHPNATEVCANNIDDNCNGQIDENCSTQGGNTYQSSTTNCANFYNGTAQPFNSMCYIIKSNKVKSSTPGVISYYVKVQAPMNGTFKVDVVQTKSCSLPLLHVAALNQIKAWNSSCTQITGSGTETYSASQQKVTVTITGATMGQMYVVSVKYDVHSIVDAASPPSSCNYYFVAKTVVGTTVATVPNSSATVNAQSSCTIAREENVLAEEGVSLDAFPNPFVNTTTIRFMIPENDFATVKVIDVAGREMERLFDGATEGGNIYEVTFDGSNFNNGIYFLILNTQRSILGSRKLILDK